MVFDDLPWPELGNVSRGATRGNQGQKGFLGPSDRDGRAVLQLRVQPGVLALRLNAQATGWYRILDSEVNRALKLTKTYWRKARRRQDYDARADQNHMELHEWLQQLKDKTMSHLEVLMQKGDIPGPPYIMPDNIELTFLQKFIERQAAGIPHNPRLRTENAGNYQPVRENSVESMSSGTSDYGYDIPDQGRPYSGDSSSSRIPVSNRMSASPLSRNLDSVMHEANISKKALVTARTSLLRAQKETQDAFMRYNTCLEAERQARQEVSAAEKRRDDIMAVLLSHTQAPSAPPSRKSSLSAEEHHSPTIYHSDAGERTISSDQRSESLFQKVPVQDYKDYKHSPSSVRSSRQFLKGMDWTDNEGRPVYSDDRASSIEDISKPHRKHSRTWDQDSPVQDGSKQYTCEDVGTLPPRKRMHHHHMGGFDTLLNTPPQSQQSMPLPS